MIAHPKQLFVSCTDCRAVFYALGFGGFLLVGPLPPTPPPPPARVLYAAAIIIPSLYLFKGLIDSAVWGRGGGGGGTEMSILPFICCAD